jgi:hypothetical protein
LVVKSYYFGRYKCYLSKLEVYQEVLCKQLIRGLLLFIGLGLLYSLCILFIEYFLWLKPVGRTILFWIFIVVEMYLFVFFVFLYLNYLSLEGIDYNQASLIINHFEVKTNY